MRNFCVPGDIDRHEWRETVAFYLEMKEEAAEMHKQQADLVNSMKSVRANRLEQLGSINNKKIVGDVGDGVVDSGKKLPLLTTGRIHMEYIK